MYKKALTLDTIIIVALAICAYVFNSILCYWLAVAVFASDIIALWILRGFNSSQNNT